MNSKSGFSPNARAENYSTLYLWRTMSHPVFERYKSWYDTGEKVFPPNLNFTPTVLKHWFCCDGTLVRSRSTETIRISAANEAGNENKLAKYFSSIGVEVSRFEQVKVNGITNLRINFNVNESKGLWDLMGDPLPGFRYKWPKSYD